MTLSRTQVQDGVIELHTVLHTRADPAALSRMAEQIAEALENTGAARTRRPVTLPAPPVRIEVDGRRVFDQAAEVELTRLEYDLLLFLCRNAGRVCDRGALMRRVWCSAEPDRGRTVDVHIRKLRSKIPAIASSITTVRGIGYRFDGGELVRIVEAMS
jgi:DNA-binding response OmpR family regulator